MTTPRLGAVVFDFDGLLVDTETPIYEATAAVFADLGHELAVEDWAAVIGRAGDEWFVPLRDRLGITLEWAEVDARQSARLAAAPIEVDLQPGVLDLVDELDARGIPFGVASSSPRTWVAGHLDRLGVLDRFATLATVDRTGVGKPAPDLYLLACADLGVAPETVVALEDAAPGIAAARAAGVFVVAVPSAITRHTDLSAADHTVAALADLGIDDLDALLASRA
jgi:HAD superfamily hydrolase (TIGR01509 family)